MMESFKRVGEMMVFDLVTFAQEYMPGERMTARIVPLLSFRYP